MDGRISHIHIVELRRVIWFDPQIGKQSSGAQHTLGIQPGHLAIVHHIGYALSFPVVFLASHKSGCPTGRAHRKVLDFSRVKISVHSITHIAAHAECSIGNLVRYLIAAQVYKSKSHFARELDVGKGDGIIRILPFLNQAQILKCVRLICSLRLIIIMLYIRVQLDDRSGPPLLIF